MIMYKTKILKKLIKMITMKKNNKTMKIATKIKINNNNISMNMIN